MIRLGIERPEVDEADLERLVELGGLADVRDRVARELRALPDDQRAAVELRVRFRRDARRQRAVAPRRPTVRHPRAATARPRPYPHARAQTLHGLDAKDCHREATGKVPYEATSQNDRFGFSRKGAQALPSLVRSGRAT
jgi:hypothetical protein